jgi:hypothetical protein
MAKNIGAGDRLARGAVRAQFTPNIVVPDKKWNAAFDDFDPEKFKKEGMPKVEGGDKELSRTR